MFCAAAGWSMLFAREYGNAGPPVIVLHGGPGAAGHMAPVARGLSDVYRVVEPFQQNSGDERLTVARHVADLNEIINVYAPSFRPAPLGASWGAMLALAYGAAHPGSAGALILVGCGTFDLVARTELQRTIAGRMTDAIRARIKDAGQLDDDARLKADAAATTPVYSYDPLTFPHEEDEVDARAHQETWDDMLRLQSEGVYPAAFAAIKTPVLMVHGTFDPHPGRLIEQGLRPHLPQLEYREFEKCGHYPWLEKAAADAFFALVRDWLGKHMASPTAP
jgi:pimeloyl-ACP methyl ester carboxylesterase